MSDEYDSPWKVILERYFQDFMAFFFPDAHDDIDWSRGYESLDTELQKIVRDAEIGKRLADKLIKVWRLDDEEQRGLIHIEVQGSYDTRMSERMYIYQCRHDYLHQRSHLMGNSHQKIIRETGCTG